MSDEYVSVKIPKELYEKAKKFIEETGTFTSVEEFIKYVLEQVLVEEEKPSYTPEEEEKIKERLRALGYL